MRIISIKKDSIAEKIGLKAGDNLLKINGKRVIDEIDYKFRISEEEVLVELEISGKINSFEIEKNYDDDLGVVFEDLKIRGCANDCVFCFVDQNPKGMREALYFRDGDYRLSYLHGHYITMTNMNFKELDRIIEQRLSPLYISVHTTNKELRKKLFLYKKDDYLLNKINYLVNNNIELHAQIVLMPGLNDNHYLWETVDDLYRFKPNLQSLSIVPVGLTKHRDGLMKLRSVNPSYAKKIIREILDKSVKYKVSNKNFILLADEWFLMSEMELPKESYYNSIDLSENGVGQVQKFMSQFHYEKKLFPKSLNTKYSFSIACGELIYKFFNENVISELNKINNLSVKLFKIKNNFYGDSVTVSGLLTGKDIIEQLKDKELGSSLWLSYRVLNDDMEYTLDNMTIDDISKELGVPINISNDSFMEIFDKMKDLIIE